MVNYLTKICVLNLWKFNTQNHALFLMPLSSCLNLILAVAATCNGLMFNNNNNDNNSNNNNNNNGIYIALTHRCSKR